jgi:hypothetical protein
MSRPRSDAGTHYALCTAAAFLLLSIAGECGGVSDEIDGGLFPFYQPCCASPTAGLACYCLFRWLCQTHGKERGEKGAGRRKKKNGTTAKPGAAIEGQQSSPVSLSLSLFFAPFCVALVRHTCVVLLIGTTHVCVSRRRRLLGRDRHDRLTTMY